MLIRKSYTGWSSRRIILLMLVMTGAVGAQVVSAPNSAGPQANTAPGRAVGKTKIRALAVVEYAGDRPLPESGKFRVIPISVFVEGRFRDAQSYLASPAPIALEEGAIYEVEDSGKSLGFVTLTRTGHMGNEDAQTWYGIGTLQKTAPDAEIAKAAPSKIVLSDSEEHRVYMPNEKKDKRRKRGHEDKSQAPGAESKTGKPGDSKPSRTEDTDRPTLKKRPAETQSTSDAYSKASKDAVAYDDPNRPRLTRGKPATAPGSTPEAVELSGDLHALAAVSDPTNKEPHTYRFDFNAQEERTYREKMIAFAASEAKRSRPELGLPSSAAWLEVNVRAYNLSLDNTATLVLTATIPGKPERTATLKNAKGTTQSKSSGAAGNEYITLVARVNLEGELRRTFIQVTDANRFDIAPRMTLVDAVDADGDGRGELLFRVQSDQGSGWGIYRAGPDDLRKVFESLPAED